MKDKRCKACGYRKIGLKLDKQGNYREVDPDRTDFRVLRVHGSEYDPNQCSSVVKELVLLVCPECNTIQLSEGS